MPSFSGELLIILFSSSGPILFGIKPGTLSKHRMPGTSFHGIDFPHIQIAIEDEVLKNVFLVSDKLADAEYEQLTGRNVEEIIHADQKDLVPFVHWDENDSHVNDMGRTTMAGLAVAKWLANHWSTNNANLVIIGYDKADRYDK